jgi:hypothetical protein
MVLNEKVINYKVVDLSRREIYLQLWYKVCFHPTLFEKAMNFIVL